MHRIIFIASIMFILLLGCGGDGGDNGVGSQPSDVDLVNIISPTEGEIVNAELISSSYHPNIGHIYYYAFSCSTQVSINVQFPIDSVRILRINEESQSQSFDTYLDNSAEMYPLISFEYGPQPIDIREYAFYISAFFGDSLRADSDVRHFWIKCFH